MPRRRYRRSNSSGCSSRSRRLLKYTQTPEFQQQLVALPPAQKAIAMAALKTGDLGSVLKALHGEAQVAQQPKFNADGTVYFPVSGDIIDSVRGTKTNVKDMVTGTGGSEQREPQMREPLPLPMLALLETLSSRLSLPVTQTILRAFRTAGRPFLPCLHAPLPDRRF